MYILFLIKTKQNKMKDFILILIYEIGNMRKKENKEKYVIICQDKKKKRTKKKCIYTYSLSFIFLFDLSKTFLF